MMLCRTVTTLCVCAQQTRWPFCVSVNPDAGSEAGGGEDCALCAVRLECRLCSH